jgi:hypothetical protein
VETLIISYTSSLCEIFFPASLDGKNRIYGYLSKGKIVLSVCGIWNVQVPGVYGHHILIACHPNPPCPESVCEAAGCRWPASPRLRTHTHHNPAGASLSAAPLAILFPRSSAPIAQKSQCTTFINLQGLHSFLVSSLNLALLIGIIPTYNI